MSFFQQLQELPPDPIFGLSKEFKKDPRPNKYTLITGYFRDENLITPVLETVSDVERALAEQKPSREYLPIDGDQELVTEIGKLVFGNHFEKMPVCGVQTVGGTGALFLVGKLAKTWTDTIGISDSTWVNHWGVFSLAGFKTVAYPYYADKELAFANCIKALKELPEKACVLLHTNCHNPTGCDFSKQQWQELSTLIKKKNLFPILDMAYQGFSGEPEEDAYAPRLFLEEGHEFALTYTCAKNFSLYSERVGALFVVGKENIDAVRSEIKFHIRGSYSNPPIHGAHIVKTILRTPELRTKWLGELKIMRARMQTIRQKFVESMVTKAPGAGWEKIANGRGLFCYSQIKKEAIKRLRDEKGFYIAGDSRINLTGLNEQNLEAFIEAFIEVQQ